MQKIDIKAVLERVRSGNYSPEDEMIAKYWIQQAHQENERSISEPEWLELKDKIWAGLEFDEMATRPRVIKLWPRIAIAAAVATIIFGAGLFFYSQNNKKAIQTEVYAQDVAPGKQGATLTLSDGKKIRLTDAANGELANEAGVSISKTASGQLFYEIKESSDDFNKINTISTAKGETYQVRLPDGSLVWLNAASSLTYTANLLEAGKRRVKLTGEGFFQVSKDKSHPFVVEAAGQKVEVLGTQFNINNYLNESTVSTTLIEGSVEVLTAKHNKLIKPGEQAQSGKDGNLSIKAIDMELAIAWKNNQFIFDNDDIHYIMRMLERWYNVEVIYNGVAPIEKFGGAVSRFDNISSVLKILEMTGDVHFKVEGRKVYVSQ